MTRIFHETEHQELFYPDADLHCPIAVHIPSALGRLGYYVCLRVPEAEADRLAAVVTRVRIGGLRPDDLTLPRGEGVKGADRIASKVGGQCWVLLCRAQASRGDGTVAFEGLPAHLQRAPLLLCTWLRFLESGQADDWLACQEDPLWATGGVPLGGIGCGKVELCRDGRFRNFSGNNNQDMPFEDPDGLPGAGLFVTADGETRVLASRACGGVQPAPALEADLAFPQARLAAPGVLPGWDVEVLASGPLVPHNLELSSLPGFLLRWTVRNTSDHARTVRLRLAWPNLVGQGGGIGEAEHRTGYGDGYYRYWEGEDQGRAEVVSGRGWQALCYGNAPSQVCASADGSHYVAVAAAARADFVADTRLGSAVAVLEVPACGQAQVDMAVVWAMPHWIDTLGEDRGLYWQNRCRDGAEILDLLFANAETVFTEAGALGRLLAETDLPPWLAARLSNCNYPLVTNSALLRDGRFSINEGPTEMSGCYGTLDQRLGAHPATQLFFPDLNRRELAQFAAIQAENGGVVHDFGCGNLERGPQDQGWPDLTCSFILQLARHAWSLGDEAFEREMYPRARRALLRHKLWADAGEGVAQVGNGLGTSYDGYHYVGTTAYVGTLWIAALRVMAAWGGRLGDAEIVALAAPQIEQARQRLETDLWNGRYYRAFGSPAGPVNDNCHAGMLAGEWYARFLAGEDVLPQERMAACAKAFLSLNGSVRFAIPPDECAPDGRECTEYGWLPYVECFALAPLAVLGEDVLGVWERIIRAMDGGGKHPCDTKLMYRPASGGQSWGAYYMTAPASWLVYDALLDFAYTPADGTLRLLPRLGGRFAVVHPLFWAVGERKGSEMTLQVRRVFGERELWIRQLETLAGVPKIVQSQGAAPTATPASHGVYTRHPITPFRLTAGTCLRWQTA